MKILMTSLAILAAWSAEAAPPCWQELCVGDHVINVARSYRTARVVAIEDNGRYVLRFLDNGGVGGNWPRADLAAMRGCSGRYCVGDQAYNRSREYRLVTVVGLQWNGKYVLRFEDNRAVGGHWDEWDLVPVAHPPYPEPEPTPFPPPVPPHPPVYEWVCRLTTPSKPEPGYVARGRTESEAFSAVMRECLAFETPYQCRRNSAMRCGQEPGYPLE